MNRNAIASVLVAALVLLAGCAGGLTGSPDGTTATDSAVQSTSDATSAGTVNFYVSDEQNAIGDFEHLNVTITRVGLKPAGEGDDEETDDVADDDADSEDADGEPVSDENETSSTATAETETDDDSTDDADSTEDDADSTEDGDDAADDDSEAEDSDAESEEWVEYEVENRTVDLTELQGANATQLASFDVPNGSYEKVFVYVSSVNGTLKDGSDQRVKLPSGKLQLNSAFTVGNGEEVDFVFDITAFEAGQSGKYILKPVISESGTDVEIDSVDDDENESDEREDDDRPTAAERALNASFTENVTRGENATLSVTRNGSAVANASVSVNAEEVGTTAADGTITIAVPENAEELEVSVSRDELEAEVEIDFESRSGSDPGTEPDGGQSAAA
ncbi:DUF4382 domain-containing protein [Halobellus clavatus]|uniref:DUF4382 domain-containing protein n=1 Tax=Halobellus clavatus TaxID=660517 RepID=A0A1H3K444_9EURY|nr:DUF4382 domain-containing protein [Halobellus clavatus]SDY46987.1 protein of unknown function [Halobellus clavatus]